MLPSRLTVRVTVCSARYPAAISMSCWVELIGLPLSAVIVSPGLRPPRDAGELRRTVAIWAPPVDAGSSETPMNEWSTGLPAMIRVATSATARRAASFVPCTAILSSSVPAFWLSGSC